MWLSLLISRAGEGNSQSQTVQQGLTEVAAAETEGILVQIGLKILLGQAMIGAQNKRLGVADHDVQPVEQTGIKVVGFVLMGITFECRDVTAVAIPVDHTAIDKGSVGKFLYGHLLDIGRHPHFQKAGVAPVIQRQRHKNLRLFCAPAPLLPCCRAAKVRIIKFDDAVQLMGFIPLPHGSADTPEHMPSSFIGHSEHCRQLNS